MRQNILPLRRMWKGKEKKKEKAKVKSITKRN
jgi:hypothetical protein